MQLTRDNKPNANLITGIGNDEIRVGEITCKQSFIISRDTLDQGWPVRDVSDLDDATISRILDLRPEVVVLGTGDNIHFPSTNRLSRFVDEQIGVEIMDSAAACRTYNLLLGEQRRVVAAIII